jgi:hypothetical protein
MGFNTSTGIPTLRFQNTITEIQKLRVEFAQKSTQITPAKALPEPHHVGKHDHQEQGLHHAIASKIVLDTRWKGEQIPFPNKVETMFNYSEAKEIINRLRRQIDGSSRTDPFSSEVSLHIARKTRLLMQKLVHPASDIKQSKQVIRSQRPNISQERKGFPKHTNARVPDKNPIDNAIQNRTVASTTTALVSIATSKSPLRAPNKFYNVRLSQNPVFLRRTSIRPPHLASRPNAIVIPAPVITTSNAGKRNTSPTRFPSVRTRRQNESSPPMPQAIEPPLKVEGFNKENSVPNSPEISKSRNHGIQCSPFGLQSVQVQTKNLHFQDRGVPTCNFIPHKNQSVQTPPQNPQFTNWMAHQVALRCATDAILKETVNEILAHLCLALLKHPKHEYVQTDIVGHNHVAASTHISMVNEEAQCSFSQLTTDEIPPLCNEVALQTSPAPSPAKIPTKVAHSIGLQAMSMQCPAIHLPVTLPSIDILEEVDVSCKGVHTQFDVAIQTISELPADLTPPTPAITHHCPPLPSSPVKLYFREAGTQMSAPDSSSLFDNKESIASAMTDNLSQKSSKFEISIPIANSYSSKDLNMLEVPPITSPIVLPSRERTPSVSDTELELATESHHSESMSYIGTAVVSSQVSLPPPSILDTSNSIDPSTIASSLPTFSLSMDVSEGEVLTALHSDGEIASAFAPSISERIDQLRRRKRRKLVLGQLRIGMLSNSSTNLSLSDTSLTPSKLESLNFNRKLNGREHVYSNNNTTIVTDSILEPTQEYCDSVPYSDT